MKKWIFALFVLVLLTGCADNPATFTDEFGQEKQAAWDFLQEQDWNVKAQKKGAATVTKDEGQHVEWIGPSSAKEWVAVSFLEEKPSVMGVPVIIVDPETKEVVGYIPGE